MNEFNKLKHDLTEKVAKWKKMESQFEEDWEEHFEDVESTFVLQLNPNSSHYDSILDDLEQDGMKSYEYWFIDGVSYRLVGFYENLDEKDVLDKLSGLGECVISVDLEVLWVVVLIE